MFGYFKRKRQQRERAVELRQLGEAMGEHLRAELELYIEMTIVPRRKAFIDVFSGQLETLDERLVEFDAEEVTRLEAAGIDYRIMLENWSKHEDEQMDHAEQSLREQLDIADAAGVVDEYRASVQEALANQRLALMSDGLEVLMQHVPDVRADHNSAPHP
jgi:hypothetical protein